MIIVESNEAVFGWRFDFISVNNFFIKSSKGKIIMNPLQYKMKCDLSSETNVFYGLLSYLVMVEFLFVGRDGLSGRDGVKVSICVYVVNKQQKKKISLNQATSETGE